MGVLRVTDLSCLALATILRWIQNQSQGFQNDPGILISGAFFSGDPFQIMNSPKLPGAFRASVCNHSLARPCSAGRLQGVAASGLFVAGPCGECVQAFADDLVLVCPWPKK